MGSNNDISAILDPNNNRVSTLQEEIKKRLEEYDMILKGIIESREKLPVQTLLKEQEQR